MGEVEKYRKIRPDIIPVNDEEYELMRNNLYDDMQKMGFTDEKQMVMWPLINSNLIHFYNMKSIYLIILLISMVLNYKIQNDVDCYKLLDEVIDEAHWI